MSNPETSIKKPNILRRFMDRYDLTTNEVAVGSVMLAGCAVAVVGAAIASLSQNEGLRDSLTNDAKTHIADFDHVEGQPGPVAMFKDTNLADIVLQNGDICHVSFVTTTDEGLFPNRAEIIDLNDCPVAVPLDVAPTPTTQG